MNIFEILIENKIKGIRKEAAVSTVTVFG